MNLFPVNIIVICAVISTVSIVTATLFYLLKDRTKRNKFPCTASNGFKDSGQMTKPEKVKIAFNRADKVEFKDKLIQFIEVHKFTPMQVEITRDLLNNPCYDSIAEKYFISKGTVTKHASNIFKKTNCKNREDFLAYATLFLEGKTGADRLH